VYLLDHPSEDASMKTPLSQMEQDDADLFGSAPRKHLLIADTDYPDAA
jgi:hypothetical protein